MSNFIQNNSGKRMDGDRFRGKRTMGRRFDSRNTGRSEMFTATCDECGKSCEVPFKPTSGKPVYCSNCFRNKGGRGSERFGGRDSGGRGFGGRDAGRPAMHQVICDECGKNCEVPFRPTEGKPVFCSDCFENKEKGKDRFEKSRGGENYGKLKEEFGILNAKLDKILSSLASDKISKPAPKENISRQIQEIKDMKPKKAAKKTTAKKKKSDIEGEVKTI